MAPEQTHGAGSRSLSPIPNHGGEFRRVDGTLACYHRGGNAIAKLGLSFNASLVLSLPPTPNHGGDSQRVDGTLACYHRGGNAIAKLGLSFIAGLVLYHPPSTNNGGGAPPWRHAMLWNAVTSIWHPPCPNAQDLLMQIHG